MPSVSLPVDSGVEGPASRKMVQKMMEWGGFSGVLNMAEKGTAVESKIGVMLAILGVSFLAVSFPTLSTHSHRLPIRVPPILFFIGKHFGTGVILATAFVHLLDDAFRSLQSAVVRERYGRVGKWTGGIILSSLLAIFLVEYISTTYVDHLQHKASAPSTPTTSPPDSSPPSPKAPSSPHSPPSPKPPSSPKTRSHSTSRSRVEERTPLLGSPGVGLGVGPTNGYAAITLPAAGALSPTPVVPAAPGVQSRTLSLPYPPTHHTHHGHHTHHTHYGHHVNGHHHHPRHCVNVNHTRDLVPIEVLGNSPRICRLGWVAGSVEHGHGHGGPHRHHHLNSHSHSNRESHGVGGDDGGGERREEGGTEENGREEMDMDAEVPQRPRVGRRRQVVGILVLQLGIMIHSLVIGLTLAVTSGSDFTSLTTAIMFHQLFEGLSLGVRIAGLPPKKRRKVLQEPRYGHGGDHEEGHGISLWTRWRSGDVNWLKPTLSFLFAVTTPFGMALGMGVFRRGRGDAQMLLVQGIMSAVSAGMLIYAATVEMMAGDFVFGDVEAYSQHHHHGHGHGGGGGEGGEGDERLVDAEPVQASLSKRVLAVLSLLLGALMMVLVGLGE